MITTIILILIQIIETINLTILSISIKQSVIFTTFKLYIRRYLQRLNKKKIILSQ